jgi:hypothetical protein
MQLEACYPNPRTGLQPLGADWESPRSGRRFVAKRSAGLAEEDAVEAGPVERDGLGRQPGTIEQPEQ